jgi:hypothetical protein
VNGEHSGKPRIDRVFYLDSPLSVALSRHSDFPLLHPSVVLDLIDDGYNTMIGCYTTYKGSVMGLLEGKVALVTGGTSGIGRASAVLLMATLGILIGRFIGDKFGHTAGAIGGIGLIVIGAKILIEHTLIS